MRIFGAPDTGASRRQRSSAARQHRAEPLAQLRWCAALRWRSPSFSFSPRQYGHPAYVTRPRSGQRCQVLTISPASTQILLQCPGSASSLIPRDGVFASDQGARSQEAICCAFYSAGCGRRRGALKEYMYGAVSTARRFRSMCATDGHAHRLAHHIRSHDRDVVLSRTCAVFPGPLGWKLAQHWLTTPAALEVEDRDTGDDRLA